MHRIHAVNRSKEFRVEESAFTPLPLEQVSSPSRLSLKGLDAPWSRLDSGLRTTFVLPIAADRSLANLRPHSLMMTHGSASVRSRSPQKSPIGLLRFLRPSLDAAPKSSRLAKSPFLPRSTGQRTCLGSIGIERVNDPHGMARGRRRGRGGPAGRPRAAGRERGRRSRRRPPRRSAAPASCRNG